MGCGILPAARGPTPMAVGFSRSAVCVRGVPGYCWDGGRRVLPVAGLEDTRPCRTGGTGGTGGWGEAVSTADFVGGRGRLFRMEDKPGSRLGRQHRYGKYIRGIFDVGPERALATKSLSEKLILLMVLEGGM